MQKANDIADSMRYDAGGNLIWKKPHGYAADSFTIKLGNRIDTIFKGSGNRVKTSYNGAGRLRVERGIWVDNPFPLPDPPQPTSNSYYYDGLGRTTGYQTWVQITDTVDQAGDIGSCRYDAIGRMVSTCPGASPILGYDGDNVIRAGDWEFFHVGGIDDPVVGLLHPTSSGTTIELFYITDGSGRFIAAAEASGAVREDLLTISGFQGWRLSGAISQGATFGAKRLESATTPRLSFFRNRIYDLETGRWTQEDPVGIAGGLNLYQFSGNNPVTFTDPFGLCPPKNISEVFLCTGELLRPVQRPLEVAGTLAMLPLSGPGLAADGAIATLGIAGVAGNAHRAGVVASVLGNGGALRTSETVAAHLSGKRSFIPSKAIVETIKGGARTGDPQGVAGQFMYTSRASSSTGKGVLEVLVDEVRGIINHVLYKSAP